MNLHRILSTSAVAAAAVLLSVGVQVLAYSAPSAGPTGGDADAPLNVGSTAQTKSGGLTVQGALNASGGLQTTGVVSTGDIQSSGRITADTQAGEGFCLGTSCITAWPNTTGFVSTDNTTQTKTGVLKLGTAPGTPGSEVSLVLDGRIRIEGGTGDVASAGQVLAADGAGGDASWKSPTTELGLQKAVSGTCSVGSSITSINATTGAVTCGPKIIAGSGSYAQTSKVHTVTFPGGQSMGSTNYAVQIALTRQAGGGNCTATYVEDNNKTATSFTFQTADNCDNTGGYIYDWIAVGY